LDNEDEGKKAMKKFKKKIAKKRPQGSKETIDSNSSLYSKMVHMAHGKGHKDKG